MGINNSTELMRKQIYDAKGTPIGWIDKTWNSWNKQSPRYFFGVKTNDNVRHTYYL
ncbi:MAG: hypothetical protein V5A68_02160 [Candidatus Thermoplasmatota archaeon]